MKKKCSKDKNEKVENMKEFFVTFSILFEIGWCFVSVKILISPHK
jgi:hypothetical protein